MGRCASCGTPVLWLRAWGFGEPRPLELQPDPEGEVVIDPDDARHRMYSANGATARETVPAPAPHRYRLHWPCPAVTPPRESQPPPVDGHRARTAPLTVGIVPHTHWDR